MTAFTIWEFRDKTSTSTESAFHRKQFLPVEVMKILELDLIWY